MASGPAWPPAAGARYSMPAVAGTASASSRDPEAGPRCRVLSGRAAFENLYRCGRRFRGNGMRIVCCENTLGVTRLGFSVSSKLGGAAMRNRFKRRVRQLVRAAPPGAVDLVVSASRLVSEIAWLSLQKDYEEFREDLRRWREQPSG